MCCILSQELPTSVAEAVLLPPTRAALQDDPQISSSHSFLQGARDDGPQTNVQLRYIHTVKCVVVEVGLLLAEILTS